MAWSIVCPHLLANPAKAVIRSAAKYPSLPGVEGARINRAFNRARQSARKSDGK
jgi:hypothetical protein